METITKSPEETRRLGEKIAIDITGYKLQEKRYRKGKAIILALSGDLGSGKTTFIQGFAEGLGLKQRIISPTFILMRKYHLELKTKNSKLRTTTQNLKLKYFYHIDLYRLEENIETEVRNLGIEEIWSNSENVVAIEWAEKIKDWIPKNAKWIKFENVGEDERKISVNIM